MKNLSNPTVKGPEGRGVGIVHIITINYTCKLNNKNDFLGPTVVLILKEMPGARKKGSFVDVEVLMRTKTK